MAATPLMLICEDCVKKNDKVDRVYPWEEEKSNLEISCPRCARRKEAPIYAIVKR